MKKLTLLCLEDDRAAALDALSDLGLLHITPVTELKGEDLETCHSALREARSTQLSLQAYRKQPVPDAVTLSESDRAQPLAKAGELLLRKRALALEIDALRKEQMVLEPYGDFNPATITSLRAQGLTVRLYHTSGKKPVTPPDGALLHLITSDSRGQYFAIVGQGDFACEASEFPLPTRSLSEAIAARDLVNSEMNEIDSLLAALSRESATIQTLIAALEGKDAYVTARVGMGSANRIAYLQGFFPADLLPDLQEAATQHGWGLVIDDPAEDDQVPTLIRNPAWVRPIDCIFTMLDILPGYREVDIRSVFLLFFALFFAILVGDAGYGAIFLAIAIFARFKNRQAPREPFRLVIFLSLCTIVWGAITGNYFGILHLPAPLRGFEIPWMKDDHNLMAFSFLVGAIHLTVAHVWSGLKQIKSTRALAQLGWICLTWFMYFLASNMILGAELPAWGKVLCPVGLGLLILFMTPVKHLKTEWADHVMLPFDVIGNFADLVSYVRLFAVGSAGLAVAIAFNELAVGTGIDSVGGAIKASIILFLGHALNIVLCLMSILVHGVRLNTLEFSGHIGLEWAGFKYAPFAIPRTARQE
ncbi:MAG: hypothetical protein HN919_00755 [Verrucomicrobia bacterium]|nr:hypothetical protein [Verrucomicrobiota bacterium]MBT7064808.1 hypothetical protein [Verrucomicrobiota bacterium]MBT7701200.1 hypothetical protein [Verrucomicrobiota bacterium]